MLSKLKLSLEIFVFLLFFRIHIAIFSFSKTFRLFKKIKIRKKYQRFDSQYIAVKVEGISKKLFIRKCFAKSLTSFYLCKKYWNSPILCIGVSLKDNDLKSHSWIEENNIPILENSNEMQKIMEIA